MNFSRRRKDNPSSLLPDLPLGAEILVIRLRSIGDVVLTLPAIEALHEWRPDFRISFLVQPFCAALVEGHPAISHVLLLTDFWPTVRMLRRRRFAAVFNMHAGPTSALLTGFSGAPLRVCWARRQYSFVYNVEVPSRFSSRGPCSAPRRGASRPAISVGGNARGEHSAGKSVSAGRRDCRGGRHSGGKGLPPGERYAVLRPGAGDASKRWPVENFAAIARWLRERYALTPVVNLGPGDEEIAAEVRERLAPLSVIVDSLDLRQLMALLGGASLFVGNDTGPTHIAAALQKRCVAIFGTSDSAAWYPWKTEHRVVENKFPCERCPRGRCASARESLCIRTISVEQVREACDALLSESRSADSSAPGRKQLKSRSLGPNDGPRDDKLKHTALLRAITAPALGRAWWRWRQGSRRLGLSRRNWSPRCASFGFRQSSACAARPPDR